MENKLLQQFLQAGLLDVGDSDERLDNIEKSIADLEAKLKKEQSLLPSYTLVALDPNIHPDEPVLAEVELIISAHWKALRAKFSERPIPIIRSVILHALYNVGNDDSTIARIIYLTATNFYPFAKLGREKEIVEKIILELGELAEENATEEWALENEESKLKISSLKISSLKFGKIEIDGDDLENELYESVQRTSGGHNPYQHPQDWGKAFSKRASSAIITTINKSLKDFNGSITPDAIEVPLNKYFQDFKKSLDQVLKSTFSSIQAIERRSKLLWWKETLYSSSLKDSYRSVNEIVQPIIMAEDLYKQLPAIVPISVDYLLKDTLLLLNSEANKKISFSELLNKLSEDGNKAILKQYFEDIDQESKRISITDFVVLLIQGKVPAALLKQYTGIEDDEQTSLTDFSVMILHNLMAEYLIPKSK